MKSIFYLLLVLSCQWTFSQNEDQEDIDLKYREDQFYIGITYDLLSQMPAGMAQNGFSNGFHLGVIRDIPINERRNIAFGLGLGYSVNTINQNLAITTSGQDVLNYELVGSGSFTKNRIVLHLVELPIEFRWRTSTAENYNFWRIYTGFKFGYVFASSYKFNGSPNNIKLSGIDDINEIQYGLTFSVGYDKINAHIYYSLSNLFDTSAKLNSQSLDISLIKIGLILYIL